MTTMKTHLERGEVTPLERRLADALLRKDVPKERFSPGRVVHTPGVHEKISRIEIFAALGLHLLADWGEVDREDWEENELSLVEGYELHSVYRDVHGTKFWIITEADRSVTTVLLPDEY